MQDNTSKVFEKVLSLVEERVFSGQAESVLRELGLTVTPVDMTHIFFQNADASMKGELMFGAASGKLIKVLVKPSKEVYNIWAYLAKSLPDYNYLGITRIADSISKNTRILLNNGFLTGRFIWIYNRDVKPC
jgi:hypothetical protein